MALKHRHKWETRSVWKTRLKILAEELYMIVFPTYTRSFHHADFHSLGPFLLMDGKTGCVVSSHSQWHHGNRWCSKAAVENRNTNLWMDNTMQEMEKGREKDREREREKESKWEKMVGHKWNISLDGMPLITKLITVVCPYRSCFSTAPISHKPVVEIDQ